MLTLERLAWLKHGAPPRNILEAAIRAKVAGGASWQTAGPGDILTFEAKAKPVRALSVDVVPVQEGSGDPSPDNVRPITGWTGATLTRTGINLCGGSVLADAILADMPSAELDTVEKTIKFNSNATTSVTNLFPAKYKENTRYTIILTGSNTSSGGYSNLRVLYTNGTYDNVPNGFLTTKGTFAFTTAAGKTVEKIRKQNMGGISTLYYEECGIFEGVLTADDFVPYSGATYPVTWQDEAGTVYGGTLDVVSGKLTVECAFITATSCVDAGTATTGVNYARIYPLYAPTAEGDTNQNISSEYLFRKSVPNESGFFRIVSGRIVVYDNRFTDKATADAILASEKPEFVYKLVTPIEYTLTEEEVSTLKGTNNLWADCGPSTVEYFGKPWIPPNLLLNLSPSPGLSPLELGELEPLTPGIGDFRPGLEPVETDPKDAAEEPQNAPEEEEE